MDAASDTQNLDIKVSEAQQQNRVTAMTLMYSLSVRDRKFTFSDLHDAYLEAVNHRECQEVGGIRGLYGYLQSMVEARAFSTDRINYWRAEQDYVL